MTFFCVLSSQDPLFTAFAAVAIATKHLAVRRNRSPAFYPRGNMVGFHDFDLKGFAA